MSIFTTGEARQRDLRPIRTKVALAESSEPGWADLVAELEQVNLTHHTAGRENPILALFRTYTYAGDQDLPTVAARFLSAIDGTLEASAPWDLAKDLTWDLDSTHNLLRHRGLTADAADAVITSYKTHATKVLTRLAA
ncbi:hypothetical protein ACWGJ9_09295 [Curtobacterium citreum]